MSRFPHNSQQFPAQYSPGKAWVVAFLTVLALLFGALTCQVGALGEDPMIQGAAHSSTSAPSDQTPDQGESPNDGDNNLEDERDNLVFLEPSTRLKWVFGDSPSSSPQLLLPRSTEPRGIEKPPRS